jgi:carboxyl-terminal processing protease
VSRRVLRSSPPGAALIWTGLATVVFALTACAAGDKLPQRADGKLFARGLSEISELYLQPVSDRRLAVAGAAHLSRLDNGLAVSDSFGSGFDGALTLGYNGRDVAFFAVPPADDSGRWGAVIADIIATAKQASPRLASLPQEKIETAVFRGMTAALDRFSRYSPPELARDQRAARDGFSGIGVTLDTTDAVFRVTAVTPHGPADRAGIRPEDQIVAINGVATAGCTKSDIVHRLRGPIGSAVDIKVRHPGAARPQDIRLNRAYVVLPTVTMARDGDIAVFRITSFNHSTTQRIAAGLAAAEQQAGGHLAGVVLDLRGNPGGLLDQAVSLADLFIPKGPIVSTVGRIPASYQYFAAAGDSIAPRLPIVVLVNGGSASAAEIVAAALQDVGRAVVVGSSSYGKGTVQTVLRLPNDGDLIVTWARLVTPSGYLLQGHGVVPTLCTADLRDDASGLAAGLQRIAFTAPGAGLSSRPRASLDQGAWFALRHACPPQHNRPAIDLALAERLLTDHSLYSAALHMLPATTELAQSTSAAPALTEADRALSSRTH